MNIGYLLMYGFTISGSLVAYFMNYDLFGAGLLGGFAIGYFASDMDALQYLRLKKGDIKNG